MKKLWRIFLLGHSHIDVAWRWTLEETKRICESTFRNIIHFLKKYPELTYAQSTALYYKWMEEKEELFDEVKKLIYDGRWEVVGGSWVECDCRIPSGEALIRQFLYGKRYLKSKLGVDVDVAWFPDSFGFPSSLPQILEGSGIKYLLIQKLNWNDTIIFPYNVFWWVSSDGSKVLVYQLPCDGLASPQDLNKLKFSLSLHRIKQDISDVLILYGRGDHGGGFTDELIKSLVELGDHLKDLGVITIKHTTARQYMKHIESTYNNVLPVYRGELYLQFHRGTLTSQADIKELIKECEYALGLLERILTIKYVVMNKSYDRENLRKLWYVLLTSQFHDVISGVLSEEAHKQFNGILNNLRNEVYKLIKDNLDDLAKYLCNGPGDEPVAVIFNPVPRKRSINIKVKKSLEHNYTDENIKIELRPLSISILPLTLRTINRGEHNTRGKSNIVVIEDDKYVVLENKFLRIKVDKSTGHIISIYSKILHEEFLGTNGLRFELYDDKPVLGRVTVGVPYPSLDYEWDSWEVYAYQYIGGVKYDVLKKPAKVEVKREASSVSISIEYSYSTDDCDYLSLKHTVTMRDEPWIEGAVEIDWRCKHKLLKLCMDMNYWAEFIAVGEPLGLNLRRNPASPYSTLYDRAMWEASFNKWLDYSNGSKGLAFICNTRFGYDAIAKTLRISLLRAPKYPPSLGSGWSYEVMNKQRICCQGRYLINYYIYPHKGDWEYGHVPTIADNLINRPIIIYTHVKKAEKREVSISEFEPDFIIMSALKLAEDENALIVRLFNPYSKRVKVTLSFNGKYCSLDSAWETTLLEKIQKPLKHGKKDIEIELEAYKIKTLMIKLSKKVFNQMSSEGK